MVSRVAGTIADWGRERGYFATVEDGDAFEAELTYILLNQLAAFNWPVWFNVGFEEQPQCSACFILSVQDTMESILDWNTKEGNIFRGGSGSGINLSNIRGSMEPLGKGGTASGPVSFMRGADAWAGTIKSGGKTRRAAKMVVLDVDHPDIREFIWCKAKEEDKAAALRDAGFDMSIDGDGFYSIQYQNANNSVRLSDEFMHAVENDEEWHLTARVTGEPVETLPARELMREIAEAAWRCADPGVQYDTTINQWHTSPNSGRINASNPCSEYMHVDDSACNLASLNLMKFRRPDGTLDVKRFNHAVDIVFLAQEIVVGPSSYPTKEIGENARAFRQLGLGYANLGAYLMANGMPYDSDAGRGTAAAITALMTGRAYLQSAKVAAGIGPYDRYAREPRGAQQRHADAPRRVVRDPGLHVRGHVAAGGRARELERGGRARRALRLPQRAGDGARAHGDDLVPHGLRHDRHRARLLARQVQGAGRRRHDGDRQPHGPDGAAHARLRPTRRSSRSRRTSPSTARSSGRPGLNPEHLEVFDVAVGERAISHPGHIKMMGAVQPFLSGAISKTVNLPESATVEDIAEAYIQSWKLGVKALAIYRDGSKTAQALRTDAQKDKEIPAAVEAGEGGYVTPDGEQLVPEAQIAAIVDEAVAEAVKQARADAGPQRRRMPRERQSITHKFSLGGHEGYITAGMYDDGSVGEIFLTDIGKEGSTLRGMMNSFATAISISLQYGVPLETLVRKFAYMRFEPEGITTNPEIPFAKSMPDYIMRWLASRFLDADVQEDLGILTKEVRARRTAEDVATGAPRATPPARPRAATPGNGGSTIKATAPGTTRAAAEAMTDSPPVAAGQDGRARPRPGVLAVRRHDAAHGLVLHVLELRQQHRLRLGPGPVSSSARRPAARRAFCVQGRAAPTSADRGRPRGYGAGVRDPASSPAWRRASSSWRRPPCWSSRSSGSGCSRPTSASRSRRRRRSSATVLAGIAAGSALGGRAADRVSPRLLLPRPARRRRRARDRHRAARARVRRRRCAGGGDAAALVIALTALLPPATALSAVTPAVVKLQLRDLGATGSVVGRLSAWATTGGARRDVRDRLRDRAAARRPTSRCYALGGGLIVLALVLGPRRRRPGRGRCSG